MIRDTYMSPAITFIFDLDSNYGTWCIVRGRHRIRDGKIPDDLLSVFIKPPTINYEAIPDEPWNETEQNPGHETILSGENAKPIRWYSEKDSEYRTGDWMPKYDAKSLPAGVQHFMSYLEKFEVQCLLNKVSENDWNELSEAYRNADALSPEIEGLQRTGGDNLSGNGNIFPCTSPVPEFCPGVLYRLTAGPRCHPMTLVRGIRSVILASERKEMTMFFMITGQYAITISQGCGHQAADALICPAPYCPGKSACSGKRKIQGT